MTYSVADIRAKLAAGETVTPGEVRWLVETLDAVADVLADAGVRVGGGHGGESTPGEPTQPQGEKATVDPSQGAADPDASAPDLTPTDAELIAEFGLGPTPSPDMLAYLRQFVRDRELESDED